MISSIPHVTIYTKENCRYCTIAKKALQANRIPYNEKKLDVDFVREYIKETFPSMKTYPIVVAGDVLIGGSTDLLEYISENTDDRSLLIE